MTLTEPETRAKVVELLEGCNQIRMDVWISSGVLAGVLDPDLVERVLLEELPKRNLEVQVFWNGPCGLCRQGMDHAH